MQCSVHVIVLGVFLDPTNLLLSTALFFQFHENLCSEVRTDGLRNGKVCWEEYARKMVSIETQSEINSWINTRSTTGKVSWIHRVKCYRVVCKQFDHVYKRFGKFRER